MLTPERHQLILEKLKENSVVKIQELVEITDSSESTIRRDLSQLEQENKLKRVHGGASLLHQKSEELSVGEKSTKNLHKKIDIANYAASFIQSGDCIFLDAGTTTLQMIPFLKEKNVIVVTNGLTHLEALLENEITTYLTGGLVKHKTRALIGTGAITSLNQYRFDKCFMGVNGIHPVYGYTTPDPEEASVKATAMKLSQEAFVLADSTKFNEFTFSKITDLNKAVILTNKEENQHLEAYLEQTTIKVVTS